MTENTATRAEPPRTSDDIRAEYAALSAYFSTVINFRFTTLGFFLAAVGLIVSADVPTHAHALLLLLVALGAWIVEMRNRSLFRELADRGIEIEREVWGYKGADAFKPFYSRMLKTKPQDATSAALPPAVKTKLLFWEFGWEFGAKHLSHTLGIDLIFLGVVAFAIWQLVVLNP
ncbi:MAG TPA: hypothetical protein PLI09_06085 [Candidatus Hydrogenedentes bacterium]|nr:hypothetical protein [Candidatus Hydrogenedentota bacterium]